MDVLADVISASRLSALLFGDSVMYPPWAMRFEPADKAGFHLVLRGQCWLRPIRGEPLLLTRGDMAILPHGMGHSIGDALNTEPLPYAECLRRQAKPPRAPSSERVRVLCGAFRLNLKTGGALLAQLPQVIALRADGTAASRERQALIKLIAVEAGSQRAGGQATASRLTEVLFVHAVRSWLQAQAAGSEWLGALRDPQIGRVLRHLHAGPTREHRIDELARLAGMSRASLIRRFTALVGTSPIRYATQWRLALAGQMLRATDESVQQVANEIGYESEFSFSRAFKREHGQAPSVYRQRVD